MIPPKLPADLKALYNTKDRLYHPKTEEQICAFVRHAVQYQLQVRVRGAAQSVQQAVFTDEFDPQSIPVDLNINLQLDQLRTVTFDEPNLEVTVGAGCNLAFDPFDPSGVSTEANGLFPQLAARNWVLPNVTPVAHQTIAGFISTGSEGGSVSTSFSDQVMAVRLVDGHGEVRTFRRSDNLNDPFYAVGTSLGLLGIIVSVTLKCLPGFSTDGYQSVNIIGYERVSTQDDTSFDFRGPGSADKPSLEQMLRTTPYARLLWWPYQSLRWIIDWHAHPMTQADEPFVAKGPRPYTPPFPNVSIPGFPAASRVPAQVAASIAYWLIDNWPNWYYYLLHKVFGEKRSVFWELLGKEMAQHFPAFYTLLMSLYFNPGNPPQHFWDIWWKALSPDSFEFSTDVFQVDYTELWVPLDRAQELITLVDDHYKTSGYSATEAYTVEISGARQSHFWLSPAYNSDSIRLNIMHFANGAQKSADYFQQFWDLLYTSNIPFRLHWGKQLPPADGNTGAHYLAKQYPKFENFIKLRKKMDPRGVFLSTYWKEHLGI